MSANAWTAVTALSALAATGSALLAVSLNAADVEAGYRLAELRREAVLLRREARAAEQRVSALRSPDALLDRARAMGLSTEYPERALELRPADIRYHLREAERAVEAIARAGRR